MTGGRRQVAEDAVDDRYSLIERLGEGAMGEVWLALDTRLHRRVAVKRLRSALTGDADALLRLQREARLASSLQHPNIVTVFDLNCDAANAYVVMELVAGESLASRLVRLSRLSPENAAAVVTQIAAGLRAAHGCGIVHRDVKPANILIGADGIAKLADFGIARGAHSTQITTSGQVIGTVAYMPPEVILGGEPTTASDVWSLGATLFAAVEGYAPFCERPDMPALAVALRNVNNDAPHAEHAGRYAELIRSMLASRPTDRPTIAQVCEWLVHDRRPVHWAASRATPTNGGHEQFSGRTLDLPRPHTPFLGRADQLAMLDAWTVIDPDDRDFAPICAVVGPPGIGKTALLLRWTHAVAAQFPDGVYYHDAGDYSGVGMPLEPEDILASILEDLHCETSEDQSLADLQARFRHVCADRRLLVVIDNVARPELVRAILPGAGASLVAVASRSTPVGLAAHPGMRVITLEPLGHDTSRDVMLDVIARTRPELATEDIVAGAMGRALAAAAGVPLSLRLIAAHLATSANPLNIQEDGVDALAAAIFAGNGDSIVDVSRIVGQACKPLTDESLRLLELVCLLPLPSVDAEIAATLIAPCDVERAVANLGELERHGLITPSFGGGHQIHDLVRSTIRQRTMSDAEGIDTRGAVRGMLDMIEQDITPHAVGDDAFPTSAGAIATRFHRRTIVAMLANHAADLPEEVARVGRLCGERFSNAAHLRDAKAAIGAVVAAEWALGRLGGQADALRELARIDQKMGRLLEAEVTARRALQTALQTDVRRAQYEAGAVLGSILSQLGQHDEAVALLTETLESARALADPELVAIALINLGIAGERLGQHHEALAHYQESLSLAREHGLETVLTKALANAGCACERLGDFDGALHFHRDALVRARASGDQLMASIELANLGVVHEASGRFHDALKCAEEAEALATDIGDLIGSASTLVNQAEVLVVLGDAERARRRAEKGLRIATEASSQEWQIQALISRGRARAMLGEVAAGVSDCEAALELCDMSGEVALKAKGLNAKGVAHLTAGALSEASRCHEQAAMHAERSGQDFELAQAFAGRAMAVERQLDHQVAIELHKSSAALYAAMGLAFYEAQALAHVQRLEGRVEHGPAEGAP